MDLVVSVVIPCYNVADCVEDAVRSAREQSHRPVEIICVDDGSSDGTLDVLRRLAATEDQVPVRVVPQANAGACAARNRGLDLAEGDYIQFLDADDILLAGKIERQVRLAIDSGRPDIVAGSYIRKRLDDGSESVIVPLTQDPWVALPRVRLGITSANLFRREALVQIGGWAVGLKSNQEYDLMFRLLKNGARVAYDEDISTVLRQRVTSISSTNLAQNIVRRIEHLAEVVDHLRSEGRSKAVLSNARTCLFDTIRSLDNLWPSGGRRYFHAYFGDEYQPVVSPATTPAYIAIYRLFGFTTAQAISVWAKRLRRVTRQFPGNTRRSGSAVR